MYKVLDNLKYTNSHEWVKVVDDEATIGITDYAQASLGEIVYAEGYEVGEMVKQGGECGAVESVKAASDILSPVSGEIINKDPYANWILKVRITDEKELDNLLDATSYKEEQK